MSNNRLGKASAEHFPLFEGIKALELRILNDRDNLISKYDARSDTLRMLKDAFERLQQLEGRADG